MPADAVIVRGGPVAAPLDYQLPTGTEIVPLVVTATLDGTNAGGAFLAVLEIISPNGTVTARCLRQESIAAGASAAVSWFPGGGVDDTATTDVDTAGGVSELSSSGGTISVTSPTGPTANVDLPATGVAPGVYGDATHVSQVQIDAEGRVTNSSSVAISGAAGAGGLVTLFDQTLGVAAASIDTGAGGIAAGHGTLIIFLLMRSAFVGNAENILLRLNNDSGANYDWGFERNLANAANAVGVYAQTAAVPGQMFGTNAVANAPVPVQIVIPSYDATTFLKVGTGTFGGVVTSATFTVGGSSMFTWRNTAAITRLAVSSQTGANLVAGSRMLVCGTQ